MTQKLTIHRGGRCYGFTPEGEPIKTRVGVVQNYLVQGGRLSQKKMTELWGFSRLSDLIYKLDKDLAREGGSLVLRREWVTAPTRWGTKCQHREYWIERGEE